MILLYQQSPNISPIFPVLSYLEARYCKQNGQLPRHGPLHVNQKLVISDAIFPDLYYSEKIDIKVDKQFQEKEKKKEPTINIVESDEQVITYE